MDQSRQWIRLDIEGRWSAEAMGNLLLAISDLYDLRLFLELLSDEWRILDRYYDARKRREASRIARHRPGNS
jgi:hypothetical protein